MIHRNLYIYIYNHILEKDHQRFDPWSSCFEKRTCLAKCSNFGQWLVGQKWRKGMEWLHACRSGVGTSDFHKQNQHKVRHGQRNIQDCMMLYGSAMIWPSDGRVMNQLSWKRDPNCQRIVLLMILHNQSSNACPSKKKMYCKQQSTSSSIKHGFPTNGTSWPATWNKFTNPFLVFRWLGTSQPSLWVAVVSKPVGRSVGADTAEWYGWKEKGRELIYIYIFNIVVYIYVS